MTSRIIEEFRGLAWSEVKPKYLDYEYCQILLIGENIEKGVAASTKDEKQNKDTPQEELEKLEHEDELRVQHLHGKVPPFIKSKSMNAFEAPTSPMSKTAESLCGIGVLIYVQAMIQFSTIYKSAKKIIHKS